VKLSIAHKFSSDSGAQRDVGEAWQPASHDGVAGRRIAGAGEIIAERGDLDQIQLRRLRTRHRVRDRHDANLLTVLTNQANLGGGDLAVDSLRSILGYCVLLFPEKNRPCRPLKFASALNAGLPPRP